MKKFGSVIDAARGRNKGKVLKVFTAWKDDMFRMKVKHLSNHIKTRVGWEGAEGNKVAD